MAMVSQEASEAALDYMMEIDSEALACNQLLSQRFRKFLQDKLEEIFDMVEGMKEGFSQRVKDLEKRTA